MLAGIQHGTKVLVYINYSRKAAPYYNMSGFWPRTDCEEGTRFLRSKAMPMQPPHQRGHRGKALNHKK